MSWTDREEYISTVEVHSGTQSLYSDGSDLVSGGIGPPVLTTTDAVLSSDFTIEFFAYAQGASLTSPVTVTNTGNSNYMVWWQTGSTLYFQWYKPPGSVQFKSFSVGLTMNDRWVHLAVSYVAATDLIYVSADGITTGYTEGLRPDFYNGTEYTVTFLYWGTSNSRLFTGYVDDFRIIHEALYTSTTYTVPDPSAWALGGTTSVYTGMEPIIYFVLYPTVGSVHSDLTWDADPDALFYRLTYTDSVGVTSVAVTGTEELVTRIENLTPESVYTIDLYSSATGAVYNLLLTEDITTLENTAANFDTSTYENSDGNIDISGLNATTTSLVSSILNDLFTTSDTVVVADSSGEVYDSTFLNLNGTVNIGDAEAILIPFDSSLATGQEGTLVTTNGDSVVVSFNNLSGEVTVDGIAYAVGDTFILDGKRIIVSQ